MKTNKINPMKTPTIQSIIEEFRKEFTWTTYPLIGGQRNYLIMNDWMDIEDRNFEMENIDKLENFIKEKINSILDAIPCDEEEVIVLDSRSDNLKLDIHEQTLRIGYNQHVSKVSEKIKEIKG